MVGTTDPSGPPLEKRFETHLLTDVEELRGRYDPRVFQQMIHRRVGVSSGLPLGVLFVGLLASDGLLLRLAAQLEGAQPWFQRYAELDPALG